MSPDRRSEEERAAARREREARRAARQPEPEPDRERPDVPDFLSARDEAATPADAPPASEPAPPPPATLRDWRAAAGDPGADPPLVRRVGAGTPPSSDPPPPERFAAPPPPVAPPPRIPPPPRPPAPGERPPARGRSRPPRRARPWRIALLLAGLAVVAAAAWFALALFQPFHGDGSGRVVVVVPSGASSRAVGDLLDDRDVVASGTLFSLRAQLAGKRDELRAGRFVLRHDMSYGAAIDALTAAPPAPVVVRVTIPEGPSRAEIAPIARRAGIPGDYAAASRRSPGFDPRRYGAPAGSTLEGFLFPATYELAPGRTVRTLVAEQLAAFRRTIATVSMRRARSKNLTAYDVLIIASMIEREAGVPRDRRLIAAVIYNRLKAGMALGIDATLRYALRDWTNPLRQSDLQRDSAFNTRTRRGLPPTPIGNPGLAALRAAANPAKVGYLYYVVKPCGNGAHAFSSTDAEFQRDVQAYNRARERAGGRSPVTC